MKWKQSTGMNPIFWAMLVNNNNNDNLILLSNHWFTTCHNISDAINRCFNLVCTLVVNFRVKYLIENVK